MQPFEFHQGLDSICF